MERFSSEILLRMNYTARDRFEAERIFRHGALSLKQTLPLPTLVKDITQPVLVSWENKQGLYQVLYILYTNHSFDQVRDSLSSQWMTSREREAIWKKAVQKETFFFEDRLCSKGLVRRFDHGKSLGSPGINGVSLNRGRCKHLIDNISRLFELFQF